MSDNSRLAVIVLAAGQGKRMKSSLPKVLHPMCGRPVLAYVLDEVDKLGAGETVVVVGVGADQVREAMGEGPRYVLQAEQNGTGDAVKVALAELDPRFEEVLVLPGDTPLLAGETLAALVAERREGGVAATLLCMELADPHGYGRVIRRDDGSVALIVEEADASDQQRAICEVNACTYAFDRTALEPALAALNTDNAQGEYYLTGVVDWFNAQGDRVLPVMVPAQQTLGINTREHLAEAEAVMRGRINGELMRAGVSMTDPASTYIDHGVEVGADTVIMPLVFLSGDTRIGEGCRVGPCTQVNDSVIGDGCSVEFSWLDGAELAEDVSVGPYSRLRPGTRVQKGAKVGSFVELKKTVVGPGSKVPHLSYVGDTTIGRDVNVGAGTITCNYDGEQKFQTEIGDGAFIGSDTMLIAPVKIGRDAVTGAGSAIAKDVPDGNLGIERCEQKNVPDFKKKKKKGKAG